MTNIQNKIEKPYIDFSDGGVKHFFEIYDTFGAAYNNEQLYWNNRKKELRTYANDKYGKNKSFKKRPLLRPVHRDIYYKLICLYKAELINHCVELASEPEAMAIDPRNPITLRTNNERLRRYHGGADKVLQCTTRTIYNYISFLIKVGIVKGKKFHGVCANYELEINPDFLLIKDKNNPKYTPQSPLLQIPKNRLVQAVSKKKFQPTENSQDHKKGNILINVDKESGIKPDNLPNKQIEKHFVEKHRDNVKSDEASQEHNPTFCGKLEKVAPARAKNPEQIQQEQWQRYLKIKAMALVNYLIARLYNEKTIYPGEREKAIDLVVSQWFSESGMLYNKKRIENRYNVLVWCIDTASRYINRSDFEQYVWPSRYVDRNNKKCGLETVYTKWWPTYRKRKVRKGGKMIEQRTEMQDNLMLHKYVRAVSNNPTFENYRRAEFTIKNRYPHLLTQFANHFSNPQTLN